MQTEAEPHIISAKPGRDANADRESEYCMSVREEAREGEKRGHIQGQKMELYLGDWHE